MSSGKVLICDDEPSLRELMRVALPGDYSFAEAGDVAEAIEQADSFRPDIVLLDVMMPGGNGLEVLRHLRLDHELRKTSVLVISAFSTEADRYAAHEAGANGFLAKPFDPDDLSATVEELLAACR